MCRATRGRTRSHLNLTPVVVLESHEIEQTNIQMYSLLVYSVMAQARTSMRKKRSVHEVLWTLASQKVSSAQQ
jgi:hypothetical protein